ncbi:hypothetical protein [Ruegeria sp. HKCCD8929]|uniref:hypothetical protein n=1 Tax=Ruegeria sp. HKCCD8929 TaxID=2683006 RepID=UPI001487D82F|nr:hypothetical protein [Ruegeria sp. HKCCD8929]
MHKKDLLERKPVRKAQQEDAEIRIDKDEDWKGERVIKVSSKRENARSKPFKNRSRKYA